MGSSEERKKSSVSWCYFQRVTKGGIGEQGGWCISTRSQEGNDGDENSSFINDSHVEDVCQASCSIMWYWSLECRDQLIELIFKSTISRAATIKDPLYKEALLF
jgi:hypothetical protein